MARRVRTGLTLLMSLVAVAFLPTAGTSQNTGDEVLQRLEAQNESLSHRLDQLQRMVDDLMFFDRLGDIADVDIVQLTGPPLRHQHSSSPNRRP